MKDVFMSKKPLSTEDAKKTTVDETLSRLSATTEGLSSAEAQKRLQQYGPNEIPEKKENPLLKFLSYFWGPIPWMIEAAIIMSAVIQHWVGFRNNLHAFDDKCCCRFLAGA